MGGVPAHSRAFATKWSVRLLPTQNIQFYVFFHCVFSFSSVKVGVLSNSNAIFWYLKNIFASAVFFKLVHSDIIVLKKKKEAIFLARNVHDKICKYLLCDYMYHFFPLFMEEFVYDTNKTLTLQLIQLQIRNCNYKAIDYSKSEFTIEWQAYCLECRGEKIQFYDYHLSLIFVRRI